MARFGSKGSPFDSPGRASSRAVAFESEWYAGSSGGGAAYERSRPDAMYGASLDYYSADALGRDRTWSNSSSVARDSARASTGAAAVDVSSLLHEVEDLKRQNRRLAAANKMLLVEVEETRGAHAESRDQGAHLAHVVSSAIGAESNPGAAALKSAQKSFRAELFARRRALAALKRSPPAQCQAAVPQGDVLAKAFAEAAAPARGRVLFAPNASLGCFPCVRTRRLEDWQLEWPLAAA